ncbi:hypothetical protein XMM379_002654 [Aliiroseovarius sp. xm-m-379]|nr:hypothetical protein [Aliiroseovarius sp. xm-d-517]NRP25948.1 hypothetical protein [Aliiroseovarius sp. xm-m-379]NRP30315.1 hypothetical protein [Aliiroseovarius sp. xm-m-314]NRP34747.1 hypothetical protein [Aliiroseovarius sp. xm-a-104]NRP40232.1 hypothetical protein [Aliiroseovarius sp. xm-m-339-2]NRP42973.1 hypothetical protein [Aliiroseovarius sp. xm-m-378]NRP49873.1 hypothetical protein [Aliiroseovarius sp. xm-m-354]NRP61238.1 hypothetical protein [Aliiroseovarius sp. xm-a-151]NRP63
MKFARTPLVFLALSGPAMAHHDKTPLREAVIDGHSHAVGGATIWLAAAVVAMVVALYAVQKVVFRKREE